MGRTINKLTDTAVKNAKATGRYSDGGGLYLYVSSTGNKSWLFMWQPTGGKRREMGLGKYPTVTLAKARSKAGECRDMVDDGQDPIAVRQAEAAREEVPTFGDAADRYIESIKSEWRNAKHDYQWRQTLGDTYCKELRKKRVSDVSTADVLKVLTPIWSNKNETASRLRGRIERVLDYAKVKGWRAGENPALWRGHLKNTLPRRQKLQRGHHPAMPYGDVPGFMKQVRAAEAVAARALELTILCVTRSNETLGARWPEFDLDNRKVWTIPAERMKAGEPHEVPLPAKAVALLKKLRETRTNDFVFPGERPKRPLSNMAMMMLLRRLKVTGITVHGFRSSFRDWVGDETSFPREVAEQALAHKVGDDTERAYRRASALEKRRKLMEAWASYLDGAASEKVVRLRAR